MSSGFRLHTARTLPARYIVSFLRCYMHKLIEALVRFERFFQRLCKLFAWRWLARFQVSRIGLWRESVYNKHGLFELFASLPVLSVDSVRVDGAPHSVNPTGSNKPNSNIFSSQTSLPPQSSVGEPIDFSVTIQPWFITLLFFRENLLLYFRFIHTGCYVIYVKKSIRSQCLPWPALHVIKSSVYCLPCWHILAKVKHNVCTMYIGDYSCWNSIVLKMVTVPNKKHCTVCRRLCLNNRKRGAVLYLDPVCQWCWDGLSVISKLTYEPIVLLRCCMANSALKSNAFRLYILLFLLTVIKILHFVQRCSI